VQLCSQTRPRTIEKLPDSALKVALNSSIAVEKITATQVTIRRGP